MIQFTFDAKKIIQIVDFLVARNSFSLNYTKMIKLLYIADKEALAKHDIVITGDRYFSMKNGPVLSGVLDLVNGEFAVPEAQELWNNHFNTIGHEIVSKDKRPMSYDQLSDFELSLLTEIDNKYKNYDYGHMINLTHDKKKFSEVRWKEAEKMGTSLHLGIEDILKNLGRTDEEIEELEKETNSIIDEHRQLKNPC
jgi:hypothetical protein